MSWKEKNMAAEKQWNGPQFMWPGTAREGFARKSGRDWPTKAISLSAAPTAISRLCAILVESTAPPTFAVVGLVPKLAATLA